MRQPTAVTRRHRARRGPSGSAATALALAALAALAGAVAAERPGPAASRAEGAPATPAPPAAALPSPIVSGLQAMHRGEYLRALEDFRRAADADPGAPGPLFYPVFARWWQGLFADGQGGRADTAFDEAYAAAVRASETRLEAAPKDADALATLGASQILRAHVEAVRGNYWRSGQEARRGKKALEQALAIDAAREQALFGMGALNYYADRVPLIVKGLRVFLFIPGGDAPRGLAQIRAVATGGGPLATDGRLLLGLVCADRYQRAYDEGLAHLERAREATGGSALIRAAIGDQQIRLARYAAAAATLQRGLEEAAGAGPEAARQRRWIGVGLAEALAGDWRLDEADAALARAAGEEATTSEALLRITRRVAAEIAARRAAGGDRGGAQAGAPGAEPDTAESTRGLRVGRRLLDAGRAAEAVPILAAAERALPREPPAWLEGSIQLSMGMALRDSGHAAEARSRFDKAIATRRFRGADRARLELGEKGKDSALCAP